MIFIDVKKFREMKDYTNSKVKWQIISAVVMIAVGAGLLIAGFIVKPTGEIHPSVLTGLGEILTFAGALFGINANYHIKMSQHQIDGESKE